MTRAAKEEPRRQRVVNATKRLVMTGIERAARLRTTAWERRHNVLIATIPRSGSSLFVKLLNDVPNCVALNEVSTTRRPFHFFAKTRKLITEGMPAPNKYSARGEITSNTIDAGTRIEHRVIEVEDDNFVLAHKHTIGYLNRLEEFLDADLEVWVLVRHPLYTLASWKRCPPHFTISHLDPPHATLAHIRFSSRDLDVRRCEVWNHYARRIHDLSGRVNVVRYEDLIEDPVSTMGRFCRRYGLEAPATFDGLSSRNSRGAYRDLDESLEELVHRRCDLSLFGYD